MDTNLFTGPLFVGNSLSWACLGISLIQVYHYHLSFPLDPLPIKALVYNLFILGTFHTVTVTHFSWFALVQHWGNPAAAFGSIPWSGWMHPLLTGIISVQVQGFFAWRIWRLRCRSGQVGSQDGVKLWIWRAVVTGIALVALAQCGAALHQGIRFALINDVTKIPSLTAGSNVWLGGSFACDILIALTMIYILASARIENMNINGGLKQTDLLITQLIINTVETGAITALTAGVDMILFIKAPLNYLHLCPSLVLPKLYCIVIMAALNSRHPNSAASRASSRNKKNYYYSTDVEDTHHISWRRPTADHALTDITGETTTGVGGGLDAQQSVAAHEDLRDVNTPELEGKRKSLNTPTVEVV